MNRLSLFSLLLIIAFSATVSRVQAESLRFQKLVLSGKFHSEGADAADFDGDGDLDLVSGPYWYEGPHFVRRHTYAEVKDYAIAGYSDHFFSFARDFNGDGFPDVLSIPIPGGEGVWYENPGVKLKAKLGGDRASDETSWQRHLVLSSVDNESPTLADINGDGIEDLVCIHKGNYGYAVRDPSAPTDPWRFVAISKGGRYGRFTHGLGVGDVDGDGIADLLEKDGWWRQGEDTTNPFEFHPVKFAASGGSQMFAYDFDGDGDQDVVSVQNAHAHGLMWFESRGDENGFAFVPHMILGDRPAENPFGLAVSQMHALALADIDGDGVKDIITGKRYWAHGGKDPGATELPVLYWFKTVRSRYGVEFRPHLIDVNAGVGTQLTVNDVDGNGHPDIIVGNKLGTKLFLNSGIEEPALPIATDPPHAAGSEEFKKAIRTTPPLGPELERESFIVPAGFKVQLVAAEPEIAKPMNMAFDARGRLWVTSSSEYPIPAEEGKGRDTIKILEDLDQDGRADKITTFADGLNIPIGLYPYRDGVICYSIPNLWFLRDTDGDDRCDSREILYGPFDYSRDTHGMCNGFNRGFDGWLYACHGFNNRSNVKGQDGHEVTMNSGNTFRVRLDGSRIEHFTDGQVNPFGMAIDPNGDFFTADCHTKPITLLMRGGVYQGFGKPHDGLGFVPDVMQHLHGSTAIGGIALYHGDAYPSVFRGNAFGGNVMTSRINRNSLHYHGSTVSAREESDFLISEDPWFRPVDLQVGPDGALYVADFYNRIIGHYEVGLDHPGRDRHRGRIWRIVHDPEDKMRRDVEHRGAGDLSDEIGRLASSNLTRRQLAADRIVDEFGSDAVSEVRAALKSGTDRNQQVQLLWILFRLEVIRSDEIIGASKSADWRVRSHANRIVGAGEFETELAVKVLSAGLKDSNLMVRRSAAMAASSYRSRAVSESLMEAMHRTPAFDQHLSHAIKIALRDHLRDEAHFREMTKDMSPKDLKVVADLCLGIRTDFAGGFLASHLANLQNLPAEKESEYLSFAARYAMPENLDALVGLARERYANNFDFQEQLVRSILDGLRQRNGATPRVVTEWAVDLARHYLGMRPGDETVPELPPRIDWRYLGYPGSSNTVNPWQLSTKRSSVDGKVATPLHSSFPKGEKLTGVYRSDVVQLPSELSFYLAGHDGYPGKPIQKLNVVRVRDAITRQTLKQWSPPRNDVAQQIHWVCGDLAGRDVFFELVDGDPAGAYAWLAAGRFSIDRLNPNTERERLKRAANLITDFRLESLRDVVEAVIRESRSGQETVADFAKSWVALNPSSLMSAFAETFRMTTGNSARRGELAKAFLSASPEALKEALATVTKVATAAEQGAIARQLASDRDGIPVLLDLIEAGHASTRLLVEPSIKNKLNAVVTQEQQERIALLTKDLPDEDVTLKSAMDARKASFIRSGGDSRLGRKLFTKHCNVCHQVAGKGVAVGPNLDGIGNRGLERLVEDVLSPNQNIDAAFKTTVLLTEDGRVVSGLLREGNGDQWTVVDQTAKEIRIAADDVAQKKTVSTSPMPANFHETLDDQQTRDLFAYLLSLTR